MSGVRPGPEPDVVDPTPPSIEELNDAVRDLFDRLEGGDEAFRALRDQVGALAIDVEQMRGELEVYSKISESASKLLQAARHPERDGKPYEFEAHFGTLNLEHFTLTKSSEAPKPNTAIPETAQVHVGASDTKRPTPETVDELMAGLEVLAYAAMDRPGRVIDLALPNTRWRTPVGAHARQRALVPQSDVRALVTRLVENLERARKREDEARDWQEDAETSAKRLREQRDLLCAALDTLRARTAEEEHPGVVDGDALLEAAREAFETEMRKFLGRSCYTMNGASMAALASSLQVVHTSLTRRDGGGS